MNKLKHIDVLISDNKKKKERIFTILVDNKRFKCNYISLNE
jgi:hypothetical protein